MRRPGQHFPAPPAPSSGTLYWARDMLLSTLDLPQISLGGFRRRGLEVSAWSFDGQFRRDLDRDVAYDGGDRVVCNQERHGESRWRESNHLRMQQHNAVASYSGFEFFCGCLRDNISFLVPCARLSPD